ncbi:MAG: GtrA family protein [Clostridia bacterium]|nr:GtrA family protein [Clostridia bacterium]
MKKEILRTIKYVLIAASAGIIQFASFTFFTEVCRFDYWLSYLIALVLSVVWNFTFNRRYTFKSANNVPKAMLKVLGYYCVFTPLSTMLEHYLTRGLGWNPYLVTFINMFLNLATEFPFQRFFVFGKTVDTNDLAQKEAEASACDTDPKEGEIL